MPPNWRVGALIVVISLLNLGLAKSWWSTDGHVAGFALPFLLLTVTFALVEWRVVHVQFRAEASSFSLLELPLVIGLIYVSPRALIPAAIVGGALGLAIGRRQTLLKVAFNSVNLGLYAAAAAAIFHGLVDQHNVVDPEVWVAIVVAILIGSMLNLGSIGAAIALTEGKPAARKLGEVLGFGLAVSGANTAIGLTGALLFQANPMGLILLLPPGLVVLAAFRMFASERNQRERVEFLYSATRILDLGGADEEFQVLLQKSRQMFRAEIAAVVLLGDGEGPNRVIRSGGSSKGISAVWEADDLARASRAVDMIDEPRIVDGEGPGDLAELVAKIGGRDAVVARLATDERKLGLFVIANRLGNVTSFGNEDVHLLGALSRQSAVLLHSDRLEQTLVQLRLMERQLAHQATHDPLTGLPNRALFNTRLDEARAEGDHFTVFYIDLDNFKTVNDTFGHAAGDQVLIEIAGLIEGLLRPADTAARLGGDEFAVLLRSHPAPAEVAKRIIAGASRPIEIDGQTAQIGCSIGMAHSSDDDTDNPQRLLRKADSAMYQAKQQGKSATVGYDEPYPENSDPRVQAPPPEHRINR